MRNANEPVRASLWLENALLFSFIMHGLAMMSMAAFLIPGIAGGTNSVDSQRIAYIAQHPWLWRIGWLPWQLTALSDILIAAALLSTRWIPKIPALAVAVFTLLAVICEQPGEFWWVTEGIRLAQLAHSTSNPAIYLTPESAIFIRVSAWAALFYGLAAIGWSICFAMAGTWSRSLTWISLVAWSILLAVAIGPLVPPPFTPAAAIIAVGNAVGFILLMVWFTLVIELVLRRSRPFTNFGREAIWRHPSTGIYAWTLNTIANSRLARRLGEMVPSPAFVSDVTDVCYVNYLVEADLLEPLVPWGLQLDRLGKDQRFALFTFLTYNHGHFGPRMLGPLRKLLPSPVQCNWRIHVYEPSSGQRGIHFITTAISNTANALAARILADGVPMHVPSSATVQRDASGALHLQLDAGCGSSPDVSTTLTPTQSTQLPAHWLSCFPTFQSMLEYCVPQDRALSSQPWYGTICAQEINLGIPLEACEPLAGTVNSVAARQIVANAEPVCFRVPSVNFLFSSTRYQHITSPT